MIEAYRDKIMQLVDECTDMSLLDFIWKTMLYSAGEGFDPGAAAAQEVERNGHNKGNKKQHGNVTVKVLRGAKHINPHVTQMGARDKEMPGVRGGADRLQSAA